MRKLPTSAWVPSVTAYTDEDNVFTTVIIVGVRYTGIGNAKRNPRDHASAQIGLDIATARALRDLADQTERGAS